MVRDFAAAAAFALTVVGGALLFDAAPAMFFTIPLATIVAALIARP